MYVVIIKTVGDLEDKSQYAGLPDSYPVECKELKSEGMASMQYPGATIMTKEEYLEYYAECEALYNSVQVEE